VGDATDDIGRRDAGFTAADSPWSDGSTLVVATKYLAHAAV